MDKEFWGGWNVHDFEYINEESEYKLPCFPKEKRKKMKIEQSLPGPLPGLWKLKYY